MSRDDGMTAVSADEFNDNVVRSLAGQSTASVYVGSPFCPTRCLSCTRDSMASNDDGVRASYNANVIKEVQQRFGNRSDPKPISRFKLAGGTSNLDNDNAIAMLVTGVQEFFPFIDDGFMRAEISLSASRTSISQMRLLRALGFNSVKFEVRDIDPTVQQGIGRSQSVRMIEDAVGQARDSGFEEVTLDFVYGLPGQTVESLRRSLAIITNQINPDRIDTEAFVPNANRHAHHRALTQIASCSLADRFAMFSTLVNELKHAGYEWIGVDCFVKSDHPFIKAQAQGTLHRDSNGWSIDKSDVALGFGVAAISEAIGMVAKNVSDINAWINPQQNGSLFESTKMYSQRQQIARAAFRSILCNVRVKKNQFSDFDDGDIKIAFGDLIERGTIMDCGDSLSLSDVGRLALGVQFSSLANDHQWLMH